MNPAEKVIELLRKIQQKIDEIMNLINKVIGLIPDFLSWVADRLRDAWNTITAKLAEMWDSLVGMLSNVGNPVLLNNAAQTWSRIGGTVAGINHSIGDADLASDDEWKGRGKDQYMQGVQKQREANTSILGDYAERIQSTLTAAANGIVAFWVAIGVALATLIGGIIIAIHTAVAAAAATAATAGVAAPGFVFPIVEVAVAVGICAVAVVAGIVVLNTQMDSAKSSIALTASGITAWPDLANA